MFVVELFSASGALAYGFRRAGIEIDLAIDRDPHACASYAANLGQRPVQIDVRDLLRMRWNPGPIDLLVADPPCAMWSRAGKRLGEADERDMLGATVELIRLLRPTRYLIGNIPGLEDKPHLGVVRRTIGGLAREGYCAADFAVLDAADFGVPQFRARPFWYGHLAGPCIRWPARTHCDPAKLRHLPLPGVAALKPWVSVREGLEHLPVEDLGRPVRLKPNRAHAPSDVDEPGKTLMARNRGNGGQAIALDPKHPPSTHDAPARTVLASDGGGSKLVLTAYVRPKREPSTRGPQSARVGDAARPAATLDTRPACASVGEAVTMGWPWDRPATTVCAGTSTLAPPGRSGSHGESQAGHPNAIVLSERAAMALQGLPAGWVITGPSKKARWTQLGQAVPVVVAEKLGEAIAATFGAAEARGAA